MAVVTVPLAAPETFCGEADRGVSVPITICRVTVVAGVAESRRTTEVVPGAIPTIDRLLSEIRVKASVESGAVWTL